MNRVSKNMEVIHAALINENYCFKKDIEFDFEHPILKPSRGVKRLLRKLEKSVKRVGYVPLSLKLFYKIVGSTLEWQIHIPAPGLYFSQTFSKLAV